MQKLLIAFAFIFFSFSGVKVSAQTKAKPAVQNSKSGATKLKSDGTPDMRYKENKKANTSKVKHLKKDGTPDKRYKENKK